MDITQDFVPLASGSNVKLKVRIRAIPVTFRCRVAKRRRNSVNENKTVETNTENNDSLNDQISNIFIDQSSDINENDNGAVQNLASDSINESYVNPSSNHSDNSSSHKDNEEMMDLNFNSTTQGLKRDKSERNSIKDVDCTGKSLQKVENRIDSEKQNVDVTIADSKEGTDKNVLKDTEMGERSMRVSDHGDLRIDEETELRLICSPRLAYLSSQQEAGALYAQVDRMVPFTASYTVHFTDGQVRRVHCNKKIAVAGVTVWRSIFAHASCSLRLRAFCTMRSQKFSKKKCVSIDPKCSETHGNAKKKKKKKKVYPL